MKQFIVPLSEISMNDVSFVGGKAASLGELLKVGVKVPQGFVVTTHVYRNFAGQQLPPDIVAALKLHHARLGGQRVAVRSSAVAEDSLGASWAGQLETFLNVDADELPDSIVKCWESMNSERATAYADNHAVTPSDRAVAVVVQAMIDSDVAGVMFTANPINGQSDEFVIESAYGLGELVVQGLTTPDTFIASDADGSVRDHQPHAQQEMLMYLDSQQQMIALSPEQIARPTLAPEQIIELIEVGKKIAAHYGVPQDIEWAISDGQLYVLQARPITTLSSPF